MEHPQTSIKNLSFVQFFNTFSLLVVLGSVSTAYYFVQYFKASVPLSFYWVLGSGVWMVYTLDHLRDGMRLKESAEFLRHIIHFKYRKVLIPSLFALGIFDSILVLSFFTEEMLWHGAVMGGLVLVYFLTITLVKTEAFKEIFIAVMVCAGMVIYPGLQGNLGHHLADILVVLIFCVMNLANIVLFSYFDFEGDRQNGMHSIAQQLGRARSKGLIYRLMASAFALMTIYAFLFRHVDKISFVISVLAMLNILLLILLQEERFERKEAFRFWGDFIYLIPAVVWFFFTQNVDFAG